MLGPARLLAGARLWVYVVLLQGSGNLQVREGRPRGRLMTSGTHHQPITMPLHGHPPKWMPVLTLSPTTTE